MSILLDQVNWPIILQQQDSDDLLLVESLLDWSDQTEMLGVLKGSFVIDYNGNSYQIVEEQPPRVLRAYPQLSLKQLNQSVQRYASQNGHCCTTKFSANNIKQIFDTVQYLEQI